MYGAHKRFNVFVQESVAIAHIIMHDIVKVVSLVHPNFKTNY